MDEELVLVVGVWTTPGGRGARAGLETVAEVSVRVQVEVEMGMLACIAVSEAGVMRELVDATAGKLAGTPGIVTGVMSTNVEVGGSDMIKVEGTPNCTLRLA